VNRTAPTTLVRRSHTLSARRLVAGPSRRRRVARIRNAANRRRDALAGEQTLRPLPPARRAYERASVGDVWAQVQLPLAIDGWAWDAADPVDAHAKTPLLGGPMSRAALLSAVRAQPTWLDDFDPDGDLIDLHSVAADPETNR
jgi:hypothetical protein